MKAWRAAGSIAQGLGPSRLKISHRLQIRVYKDVLSPVHSGMTPPGDAVEVYGMSILGAAAGEL